MNQSYIKKVLKGNNSAEVSKNQLNCPNMYSPQKKKV